MASVSQSITKLLNEAAASSALSAKIDADEAQTSRLVEFGVPAIVGGIADRAAEPGGIDSITTVADVLNDGDDEDASSLLEDLERFVIEADPEGGADLLTEIFGSDRGAVVGAIAEQGEIPEATVDQTLPILAPIVVAELRRKTTADDLDDDGLRALLAAEKADLAEKGPFDFGQLSKVAVGVGAGAAGGSVVAETGVETGTAGETGTAVGRGAGTAVAEGVVDALNLVDEAGDVATTSAAGSSHAPVPTADPAEESQLEQSERDRSPVGLIGLAVGWLAAVLLVGWALSLLDGSNGREVAGDQSLPIEQDAGTGSDGNDTDGTGDGTGAGTADGSSGDEDTTNDDTDEAAGSETGTEAGIDVTAVQAEATAALTLVDADVSVTVGNDGSAILTGVAQSQQARSAAQAAVENVDGVTSVVNRIEIEAEGAGGTESDTGDTNDEPATINDELNLGPITFDIASATITAAGRVELDETVDYLEQNPDVVIEIAGHTDASGSEATNQSLSQQRADAVKAYLESAGIDGDRMTTKGYGASRPVASNDTAAGRAENRRIEFVFN